MPIPEVADGFTGTVTRITLGAGPDAGGTRTSTVAVGGAHNVVYGGAPGDAGQRPVIAMDVLDTRPADWPEVLLKPFDTVADNPGDWAKKCVEECGADLICLKFDGIHPDKGDKDAEHAVKVTKEVLDAVGVPLVLWSSGNDEKDNQVMPKVSQAAKGENCLIGTVEESNYKSLTAIAFES